MNLPFDGAWYQNLTPDVNDQIHIINIFDFFFKKYVRIRSSTWRCCLLYLTLDAIDPFVLSRAPPLCSPLLSDLRSRTGCPHHRASFPSYAGAPAPLSPPPAPHALLLPSQETGWSEWKRTRWSASGRRSSTPMSSTSPSAAAGRRYAQSPLRIPFRSTHARPPWIRARDVDLPRAEHPHCTGKVIPSSSLLSQRLC